jgi:hypothetical protein
MTTKRVWVRGQNGWYQEKVSDGYMARKRSIAVARAYQQQYRRENNIQLTAKLALENHAKIAAYRATNGIPTHQWLSFEQWKEALGYTNELERRPVVFRKPRRTNPTRLSLRVEDIEDGEYAGEVIGRLLGAYFDEENPVHDGLAQDLCSQVYALSELYYNEEYDEYMFEGTTSADMSCLVYLEDDTITLGDLNYE